MDKKKEGCIVLSFEKKTTKKKRSIVGKRQKNQNQGKGVLSVEEEKVSHVYTYIYIYIAKRTRDAQNNNWQRERVIVRELSNVVM